MFDIFTVLSQIYDVITSSLKWFGYIFSAIVNVFTLPNILSLYLPSIISSCLLIVIVIGGVKTIISLLPF